MATVTSLNSIFYTVYNLHEYIVSSSYNSSNEECTISVIAVSTEKDVEDINYSLPLQHDLLDLKIVNIKDGEVYIAYSDGNYLTNPIIGTTVVRSAILSGDLGITPINVGVITAPPTTASTPVIQSNIGFEDSESLGVHLNPSTDKQVIGLLDFDSVKIIPGEDATPSTFLRAAIGLVDSDSALSEGIISNSRGSALLTSDNSRLLCHFDADNDVNSSLSDVNYTYIGDSLFASGYQGYYRGSYTSFNTTGNLLNVAAGIDSSMTTTTGWSLQNNTIGNVILGSSSSGIRLRNILKSGSSAAGVTTLGIANPISVSSLSTRVISMRILAETLSDLNTNSVSVNLCLAELNGTTPIKVDKIGINTGTFKGVLSLENIVLDSSCTVVNPYIEVNFTAANDKVDIRFKNFMIVNSTYVSGYSNTSYNGRGVTYNHVVSSFDEQLTVTAKTKLSSIYTALTNKPYSPMSIIDTSQNKALALIIAEQSVNFVCFLGEVDLAAHSITAIGNQISLRTVDFNKDILIAIRMGKIKSFIELVIVDSSGVVHVAEYPYPDIYKNKILSIGLGAIDTCLNTTEGPITELRYDAEWLNNQQLQTMSSSKNPYVNKNTAILTDNDIKRLINGDFNQNKLPNPDGRLWTNHWNNLPAENLFRPILGHPIVNNGFSWIGGAVGSVPLAIESNPVAIDTSMNVKLQGRVYCVSNTAGTLGIGLNFYTDATKGTQLGTTVKSQASIGSYNNKYSIDMAPPVGATVATVVLYANQDVYSTGIYWSELKMEQGDYFTHFQDDRSPKHALYA